MTQIWKCGPFEFDLSEPLIMGITNVTPDSFSDGGDHNAPEDAVAFAKQQLAEGADIIDVGGESTRPGSAEVSVEEELSRVLPVVRELAGQGVAVSVDTRHAEVARACVEAGACIINDVSGFRDRAMREVACDCDAGLVIMHMLGEPGHMQDDPQYDDVVAEVEASLTHMATRLESEGVEHDRICLDPGVGFGKNAGHNDALLMATEHFASLGYCYMVAVSRKSFIGTMTGIEEPKDRDEASALCAAAAIEEGAQVARVHNVALTKEVIEKSRRAIVALGSNMDSPQTQIDRAVRALRHLPHTWVSAVSPYYQSEPAYRENQADFVNAVAVLQTTLSAHELLDELHNLEDAQGRMRTLENGPRTLDLDIVDFEGETSDDPKLILPHPKALERDFVVTPLLAVLPHVRFANGVAVDRSKVSVGKVTGIAY
ncbi:MAG: dihydropteroate synthase [Coriobacteriales bacterium]|jgi:dihydropteroate synthase